MELKLADTYKGGNNSLKLDPYSLNQALKEPFWLKEDEAFHIIRGHMENFKKPYVATSWGKDSTVLAHLVLRVVKELDIKPESTHYPIFILGHTNNIYAEEKQYWDDIKNFLEIPDEKFIIAKPRNNQTVWSIAKEAGHLPNFRRTSKSKSHGGKQLPYKMRKEPECCDILKRQPLSDYLKANSKIMKFDLNFAGLRAEESQMRRLNLLLHCRTYSTSYGKPYKIRTCLPLGFWTMENVDEYFKKHEIPLNPAYSLHKQDRLGCASCPAHMDWEERLAKDPTKVGKGMLYMNLKILRATQPNRFKNTIYSLRKKSLAEDTIQKVLNEPIDESWTKADIPDVNLDKQVVKSDETMLIDSFT